MPITDEIVEAFLRCETKAYLKFNATSGAPSDLSRWQHSLREKYREECYELLRVGCDAQWYSGTPDLRSLKSCRHQLILDYVVSLPEIQTQLDALVLKRKGSARIDCPYAPIRFVPNERIAAFDKLRLAFDAVAFSKVYGKTPRSGTIIHGRDHTSANLPLTGLVRRIQCFLGLLSNQQAKNTEPPLALNKHCGECEFQSRCREIATAKNDLSLLTTLSAKERKKQNDKGIFTVLQCSYTFRSPRRSASTLPKHQPALKALAIRKQQVHILDTPTFSLPGTPVYIDVEGDPDRDFYYLIGLRIASQTQPLRFAYWADTEYEEREMWANCVSTIGKLSAPRLMHYGAYETQFLKRMRARYPEVGSASLLDELIKSAQNLVSIIYPHVYLPTYTNGLKEIASYLGHRWSGESPSGAAALGWRLQWEASREPSLKDRLIVYNAEDCEAAEKVAAALFADPSLPLKPTTQR